MPKFSHKITLLLWFQLNVRNNAWEKVPRNVEVILAFWAWSDYKVSDWWVLDQLDGRSNSQVLVFFVTYLPKFCLNRPWGWVLSHFNHWPIFFLQVKSLQINQRMQFLHDTLETSIKTVEIVIFDFILVGEWQHHVNFKQLLFVRVSWTAFEWVLEWESSDDGFDVIASLVFRPPLLIPWHENSNWSKKSIFWDNNIQELFIRAQDLHSHNHVFLYGFFCFSQQGIEHFFLIKLIPFNDRHLEPGNYFVSDQFVVIEWGLFAFEDELDWVHFGWILEHFQ